MPLYREATLKDDSRLLKLINSAGMPGIIQLMTTRAPSFFNLIAQRGQCKVIVAEEENEIVGIICINHETVFLNKVPSKLFYICDFRVQYAYRKKGIGLQLTNKAVDYMEEQDGDFVFLNVSKGNKRPFVFFSNRKHYPDFENIGIFNIYQFLGSKKKSKDEFQVVKTTLHPKIIEFLNEYHANYQLAPVVDYHQLKDATIYKVEVNGDLIAVMCIVDYSNCKQHIALKLPWYLRLFVFLINLLGSITGANPLPSTNQPIKMLYIKYLAIKKKDKKLIRSLIRCAQNEAHSKSYSFVSLGLHEKDALIQRLPRFFRIKFNSVGMLVTMKNNHRLMDVVRKGIPYKDFSTV
tara:strand:- start:4539 stop:5588 length:1050 start_codon:yes stop_codon:yes gene_type:complete